MRPHDWARLALALLLGLTVLGAAQRVAARHNGALDTFLPLALRAAEPDIALPDGRPSWSAPIAVSPRDGAVWVVNPDSGTVTVLREGGLETVAERRVGTEPWAVVVSPTGRTVYVLDRALGAVVAVDAATLRVRGRVTVGPEPIGIALSPTGALAYVTGSSAGEAVVLDTASLGVIRRIPLPPDPYGIAVTDDGDAQDDDEQVYVTHFYARPRPNAEEATDDGREGYVSVLDAGGETVTATITLAPNRFGFPNLLSSIAIARGRAWVPQVRAAPALPTGLTTTVFAAVSTLDLTAGTEAESARLDLNDLEIFGSPVNNPVAAVPNPEGETLYVVLAGSDLVEEIDIATPDRPRLVRFLRVGRNPRGIALSPDGRRGYVMNYLSHSVTVLDLERNAVVAETPVTTPPPDATLLEGKILFNNATDPRLSRGGWVSCASCHPDGGTDSVTWIFPDGPRQTPPLWGATDTLPWHWSAALDEPQDVEETIQVIQHGLGLAPGPMPALLGAPNAGRAAALDALAHFMAAGVRPPAPPPVTENVAEGRALFAAAGCAACHGGPTWTTSRLPGVAGTLDPDGDGTVNDSLRDVGTLNPDDVRGADGFDPPSLLLVGLTPPYLHDGSMPTLERLLASGHPDPQGQGNHLEAAQRDALVAFLRSIGAQTEPMDTP